MPSLGRRGRCRSLVRRCSLLLAVAMVLCPYTPATAQDSVATALADSSQAAATACRIALSLREDPARYDCRVEAFTETVTEYIVRVRESPRDGTLPLPFSRSTVQIQKSEPSVTVTRIPEL